MTEYFYKKEKIMTEVQTLNKPVEELYWPVFYEDFNAGKIIIENVFKLNWPMLAAFYCINKQCKEDSDFDFFSKAVNRELQHELWARCQYEVVVTSWPPYVDGEEIDRLVKEKAKVEADGCNFYRTDVNPEIGEKVDAYQQVMMNWDNFISYLWNNRKLLSKYKKYADSDYCKYYKSLFKNKYKDWKNGEEF